MKNIIIIGASGFIGTNLLEKMKNKDFNIIAVSLNMSDFPFFIESDNIIYQDYKTFKNRKEDLSDYLVLNFAYTRSVDETAIESSKQFTYDVSNVLNGLNIKEYAYISTQSVYNEERKTPAKETDQVFPKNIYGEGKVHLENWLKDFSRENDINLSILRLGSVVGKGMETRITTRFVEFALASGEINVLESGQIFSFIHISDLVDSLIVYMENYKANNIQKENGQIYNIGTEESYTLSYLAEMIKEELKKYNKEVKIIIKEKEDGYKNNSVDMSKFFTEYDWRPKFTLKEIILEEIERRI